MKAAINTKSMKTAKSMKAAMSTKSMKTTKNRKATKSNPQTDTRTRYKEQGVREIELKWLEPKGLWAGV